MASFAARLHSSRFQTYRRYSSPCYRCARAHHSCCSCASSGRGPESGRGYQPRSLGKPSGSGRGRRTFSVQNSGFFGSSGRAGLRPQVPATFLRETVRLRPWTRVLFFQNSGFFSSPGRGRAPAAGTNHAPPGDRQAAAVDEGPFCPELRVLRLIPTGVETRIPTGVEIRTNFNQGDRDFYTQLTHAVYTNHPAVNSDVWVPVTTKRVKSQVDFLPGGFSSFYMRGCLLSGKNKFSGSAN